MVFCVFFEIAKWRFMCAIRRPNPVFTSAVLHRVPGAAIPLKVIGPSSCSWKKISYWWKYCYLYILCYSVYCQPCEHFCNWCRKVLMMMAMILMMMTRCGRMQRLTKCQPRWVECFPKLKPIFCHHDQNVRIQHFETARIQNIMEKVPYYRRFKAAMVELKEEVGKFVFDVALVCNCWKFFFL